MATPIENYWTIKEGNSPIIALANHNGHFLTQERMETIGIDEATRTREEDPFTDAWTKVTDTRIITHLSRFEVDLNRPREKAIYRSSNDAWGLAVWKRPPTEDEVNQRLKLYDRYYKELRELIERKISKHVKIVLLDIHSYNHRRGGPTAKPDDPAKNPEINIGTGTMNRSFWNALVDTFIEDLRRFDFEGRSLDVRENIRFRGANVPFWVHTHFSKNACAIAMEVKKFFMDEWTGEIYPLKHRLIGEALKAALPNLLRLLKNNLKV